MRVTAGMVARVRALAEPHWSPDGSWLAYLESFDGRGDVMLLPDRWQRPDPPSDGRPWRAADRIVRRRHPELAGRGDRHLRGAERPTPRASRSQADRPAS